MWGLKRGRRVPAWREAIGLPLWGDGRSMKTQPALTDRLVLARPGDPPPSPDRRPSVCRCIHSPDLDTRPRCPPRPTRGACHRHAHKKVVPENGRIGADSTEPVRAVLELRQPNANVCREQGVEWQTALRAGHTLAASHQSRAPATPGMESLIGSMGFPPSLKVSGLDRVRFGFACISAPRVGFNVCAVIEQGSIGFAARTGRAKRWPRSRRGSRRRH